MDDEGTGEKEDEGEKREIGKLAVWSVSSFKPGNGVDLLRDSNIETYWQLRLVSVSLCLCLQAGGQRFGLVLGIRIGPCCQRCAPFFVVSHLDESFVN